MPSASVTPELFLSGRDAELAGDLELALNRYRAALEHDPLARQPGVASEVLRAIARVHQRRGDYADALNAAERSLEQAHRSGEDRHIVSALNSLAVTAQCRGNLEQAEDLYVRAAQLADDAGFGVLAAHVKQNLATLDSIRGDVRGSLERYRAALADLQRSGELGAVAYVLTNMALALAELQDFPAAQQALRDAHFHASNAADLDQLALVEVTAAGISLQLQDWERARQHCDKAFELYTRLESKSGLAETYKWYGLLYRESGKPALAEAHLLMVVQLAQECEDRLLEAEGEYERALVYLAQGRSRDVLQALNRAQRLFNELRASRQVADIEQRLDRLQETYLQVVRTWGESIESKDNYTAGHCGRVADYACILAEAAGFSGRDIVWIRMGAFLHDVGKTAVPGDILNKPGPLDEAEWTIMKSHTGAGAQIVEELNFPFDIRPIVRNHHERWDGSGYPDGLKGDAIPVTARILCIADVYDALTTTRSYRAGFPRDEALRIMDEMAGTALDPQLYRLFQATLLEHDALPLTR